MYFAIIEVCNEIGRLATIAYGEKIKDVVQWFVDEFYENYDMYRDDTVDEQGQDVLKQCKELEFLANNDALDLEDVTGLSFGFSDVSVEIVSVFEDFESLKKGFDEYISDKPKYKKIKFEEDACDIITQCDKVNTLLIRESI